MLSSTGDNLNELITKRAALLDLAARPDLDGLLREFNYDWDKNEFESSSLIARILRDEEMVDLGGAHLNRAGRLFLARLLIHFKDDDSGTSFGTLADRYRSFRVLASGKNSIVVKARHRVLDTEIVLKLIRPGASADLAESARILSALPNNTAIVRPSDYITARVRDALGAELNVECLAFPLVPGITLREFLLQKNHHLNTQVVIAFARQVGGALRELEAIGAYHGDLHQGNILVDEHAEGGLRFRIVDISFDAMGSLPDQVCRNNDLANFKQDVWRVLTLQRSFLPGISIRKYIGTESFIRVRRLLSEETSSFADVISALTENRDYAAYVAEKGAFIAGRFERPASFRLQRYEEITDPSVAVKLFVPFPQLMARVAAFSNVYVSGNRGSGKSTYLASLAFFPESRDALVNIAETYGVYFPCRQGEFRSLSGLDKNDASGGGRPILAALILKILRRVLETLAGGVRSGRLNQPSSLRRLRDQVERFVPAPGLVSVEEAVQSELENFASTMVRVEMEFLSRDRRAGNLSFAPPGVGGLIEFLAVVRETFSELAATRFHLLFDDAGVPYVPRDVQAAINDLMLSSNSLFCVKLSAEKLTFEFQASEGKVLENGQDYFEHDISSILFIGSGSSGLDRSALERYFREIVGQRLEHFGYQSANVVDYLGDEQIALDRLLGLLASGRKDAYYCGWTAVWNIADRTPRNLLEIVSEIFSVAAIRPETPPSIVPNRSQNRAIHTISEKRLESLSQIPGFVEQGGKRVSLGRALYGSTVAIGSTFRRYLRGELQASRRFRQHLAIERNDLDELSPEAAIVLSRLITFGVLDSGKAFFARDDNLKKPVYVLNRIFCPAFQIGYRRDDHLRLSRTKLEMLLLSPQQFVREGTRRLRDDGGGASADLFGSLD